MSNPLQQLDMFSQMPEPVPTVVGLHWHKPDGSPLLCPNGLPAKYEHQGVVWSGRGRLPFAWQKQFSGRAEAVAKIEASMVKRGYRRANP